MAALILLTALAAIAVVATIVTVVRDGYRRVPTLAADRSAPWSAPVSVHATRLG